MIRRPRRTQARRTDTVPTRTRWIRGICTLVLLAAAVWVAASVYSGVPFTAYETYYAQVPQVGDLLSHDPVRIAGVRVGQVLGLSSVPSGDARIELQLSPGTRVPAGTRVAIRANGLLGARYVQLIPGPGPRRLAQRSTITGSAIALSNGIPQFLNTFDVPTRRNIATSVNALGLGVLGRGSGLGTAILRLSGALVPFQQVTAAILDRPGAAARLVPALASAVTPFAESRLGLSGLIRYGADSVHAFTQDRAAVTATLARLPGALQATAGAAPPATRLLAATDDLATQVDATLPALQGGLRQTRLLLRSAPQPLRRTDALLGSAATAVPSARALVRQVQPVLPRLSGAITSLRPMADQIAPYGCDIANFAVVFRSVTGYGGVGTGPNGSLGEFRLALVSPNADEALGLPSPVKRDAYPPPCQDLGNHYPHPA